MDMVLPFLRLSSTRMGRAQPPPSFASFSLSYACHTQFWRRQRSFLEMFIVGQRRFICLLRSVVGSGGDRKRMIDCHPWRIS